MPERPAIVSVNVGRPREVQWKGRTLSTAIFKRPVEGPVRARGVNLEGDGQADLDAHGGPEKAIYAFPAEHYPQWKQHFPDADWTWGALGENLTTRATLEEDVRIGDRFRCGDAELVVTQPRLPCLKLAARLNDQGAVRHMLDTGQTGFYLTIAREGALQAGDAFERIDGPADAGLTIAALVDLYRNKDASPDALRAAADAPHLLESWRGWLHDRAAKAERRDGAANDAEPDTTGA